MKERALYMGWKEEGRIEGREEGREEERENTRRERARADKAEERVHELEAMLGICGDNDAST